MTTPAAVPAATAAKTAPARRSAKKTAPARPAAAKADAAPAAPAPAARKEARKRLRLVRDSFTMPEADLALVAALKARAIRGGRETKKSEVVRAAIQVLSQLDDAALQAALQSLPSIKVGRPKKAA